MRRWRQGDEGQSLTWSWGSSNVGEEIPKKLKSFSCKHCRFVLATSRCRGDGGVEWENSLKPASLFRFPPIHCTKQNSTVPRTRRRAVIRQTRVARTCRGLARPRWAGQPALPVLSCITPNPYGGS